MLSQSEINALLSMNWAQKLSHLLAPSAGFNSSGKSGFE